MLSDHNKEVIKSKVVSWGQINNKNIQKVENHENNTSIEQFNRRESVIKNVPCQKKVYCSGSGISTPSTASISAFHGSLSMRNNTDAQGQKSNSARVGVMNEEGRKRQVNSASSFLTSVFNTTIGNGMQSGSPTYIEGDGAGNRGNQLEDPNGKNNPRRFFMFKDETLDSIEKAPEIPDKLKVRYTTDFNILWVHKVISTYFSLLPKKLPKLRKDLEFKKTMIKKVLTGVDKYDINTKINKLEEEIRDIEGRNSWQEYTEETKEYIERYKEIRPMHKIIRFGKKDDIEDEDQMAVDSRVYVINEYLEIASKYYPIDVCRESVHNPNCPVCGNNLETEGIESDGVLQCFCGYEQIVYSKESMYKDTTRVESNRADNNYQDRDNFEKAIIKYQGKQDNNLPKSLFVDLDNYCSSYGFPISEDIKKMGLNRDGTRGCWKNPDGSDGKTSRDFLFKALKETGYSDYYDDERLIVYLYWNWPRPNISNLEDKLMEDYDKTQVAYVTIPKKRKSSLNTQYRLFRHLQANNHKCTIDDFRVVKTPEILQEHDLLWKTMCIMTKYPLILSYH